MIDGRNFDPSASTIKLEPDQTQNHPDLAMNSLLGIARRLASPLSGVFLREDGGQDNDQ